MESQGLQGDFRVAPNNSFFLFHGHEEAILFAFAPIPKKAIIYAISVPNWNESSVLHRCTRKVDCQQIGKQQ